MILLRAGGKLRLVIAVVEGSSSRGRRLSGDRALSACELLAQLRQQADDLQPMILDPNRHPQGLNRLAAHALELNQPHAAFAFADRRCRIKPLAGARDYLLRAEASRRLGDRVGAADDVRIARELDPLDLLVNLQALRCLDGLERTAASAAIVANPTTSPAQLAQAIAHLGAAGTRVIAQFEAGYDWLVGWVTWPRDEILRCVFTAAEREAAFVVVTEPHHPLASRTRSAAAVMLARSPLARSRLVFYNYTRAEPAWTADFGPAMLAQPAAPALVPHAQTREQRANLIVIVPVYEDLDATTACLDSLRAQTLPGGAIAVVVVEDASPNPQITAALEDRARRGDFALIRNPRNLGFAASVNAAAATRSDGEILILNADTVLPPRALERMLAVLQLNPTAGTVTPLSNNGELTSFPILHSLNPLPARAELLAWDAAAAAHAAEPIDLPNGIGFCLLVRRACWERLGGIASIYGRGYYEDVDFCLRARDLGYRNLCATNLMVGHAGSRSFQGTKRALVMRNLEVMRTRFPTFEVESAAFLQAAPLRPVFAAIERRIPPLPHDVVLVTALSDLHPTPQARIRALRAGGERVLLLSIVDEDTAVALRSMPGCVPQSLRFTIDDPDDRRALLTYLVAAAVRRIEVVGIEGCPSDLLDSLLELGCPLDVLVADLRSLAGRGDDHACAPALPDPALLVPEAAASLPWWTSRLRPGDRVIGSDVLAVAAARRALAGQLPALVDPVPHRTPAYTFSYGYQRATSAPKLAILAPVPTGAVARLIVALRNQLALSHPEAELLVIGTTINDRALIAGGGAFVTGPVPDEEFPRVVAAYGHPPIILPYRDGLFHLIDAVGPAYPAAVGYFEWAASGVPMCAGDLVLDPTSSDAEAAGKIVDWFAVLMADPGAGEERHA